MDTLFIWGILALVCGGFMLVYGGSLVRFVLAFFGFYLGFVVTGLLLNALGMTLGSDIAMFIVQAIVGAVLGLVFYNMVQLTVYLAGGILGLALGAFVISLLGLSANWATAAIAIVAAVIGGIFGKNLGDWLIVIAASVAGAYAAVTGIGLLFSPETAEAGGAMMPTGMPAIVVFLFLAVVGTLAQSQIRDLRRRLVR